MRNYMKLFSLIALCLLCLDSSHGQVCPDPPPQTSGIHRFRQQGESFEIPITLAGCDPVALDLRWVNGRNNGSNFTVTFLDSDNQPIYSKVIWGFMSGTFQFPFATLDPQPWYGSRSMISVPSKVVIQAVPPFAFPASISYTVTRTSGRSRTDHPELDEATAMKLRTAPGRLLVKGQSGGASESRESLTYALEEVALAEPTEVEIYGTQETVEIAYRLTLTGGALSTSFEMIWIDDAALPVLWRNGSHEVGTLIYDVAVLRDGAEMFTSNYNGTQMHSLPGPLKLPESLKTTIQPRIEAGNAVVGIHGAVRIIGATRQPLIQIELKTSRPFPAKDTALQLQVGKRLFLNELSGDFSGRLLTLTLTPEMFAELKQGAEIVAFFNKPDRSGLSGRDIWYFSRLDKNMLMK